MTFRFKLLDSTLATPAMFVRVAATSLAPCPSISPEYH
ncbi:hypothetical protein BVI1335_750020 [Burkholderia vietnamiensis]|nr:hypothetical protein BVI1335_750020 [Burkholderia vietnamiensis]